MADDPATPPTIINWDAAPPTVTPELIPPPHAGDPPPRCKRCGYALVGLTSPGPCPECSRPFNIRDASTYTLKPPFIWWRYWLPGFLLAAATCLLLEALLGFGLKNWGYALWIALPVSAGAILGFGARVRTMALAGLGIVLVAVFIGGAVGLGFAGAFCGMILSVLTFVPVIFGIVGGVILREFMRRRDWSQRSHLPLILLAAIPVAWAILEGPPDPNAPIEIVSTERIIDAPPGDCWDGIVYYEQVTHEPPWILKVGLARPLNTSGVGKSIGDVKVCIYNKGHITKRITESEPGRILAFDVIDQDIGYERDVRLVRGGFRFEPFPGGKTRLTLTTEYRPLLGPRFAWRWGEHIAVHTLHDYVAEGVARRAEGRDEHAESGAPCP